MKKVDGGGKYMVSQIYSVVATLHAYMAFMGKGITLHTIFIVSLQELKSHE